MGRSVVLDRGVADQAQPGPLGTRELEIGVIVGRRTPSKDYALRLMACPSMEGECAVSLAPSSRALAVDGDWVEEHAAQVASLLPGGLDVLGLYAVSLPEPFQASHASLCALAARCAGPGDEENGRDLDAGQGTDATGSLSNQTAPLLLNVHPSTGKLSMWCSPRGDAREACSLSVSFLGADLLSVAASLPLSAALPAAALLSEDAQRAGRALGASLCRGADRFLARCLARDARGRVLAGCAELGASLAEAGGGGVEAGRDEADGAPLPAPLRPSQALLALELLSPLGGGGSGRALGAGVAVEGSLDLRAVLLRHERLAEALEALRCDARRSCQQRVRALLGAEEEEAEGGKRSKEADAGSSRAASRAAPKGRWWADPGAPEWLCRLASVAPAQGPGVRLAASRRVWVHLPGPAALSISEHVPHGAGLAEARDRAAEIVPCAADASCECIEAEGRDRRRRGVAGAAPGASPLPLLGALLAAVLAVLLAAWLALR